MAFLRNMIKTDDFYKAMFQYHSGKFMDRHVCWILLYYSWEANVQPGFGLTFHDPVIPLLWPRVQHQCIHIWDALLCGTESDVTQWNIYIYAIQCSLCHINGEVCYVAMLHYVGPCYIMSSTYIICWWYSMRRVSLELGFLKRTWLGVEREPSAGVGNRV